MKAVMFDLDGTLLPMDQEKFIKYYFGAMCKKLGPHGFEPKELVDTIWLGTKAVIKNNGAKTNLEVFWDEFCRVYGENAQKAESLLDDFYRNNFDPEVRDSCGYNPQADIAVKKIKEMGYRVILATNPIFPRVATEWRIEWAGLDINDFDLVTVYENSRHCKPSLDYYKDILEETGFCAEDCLMVGNDISEDMVAEKLGMKVFLMPECIINKDGEDISRYPQGNFNELIEYIKKLKA